MPRDQQDWVLPPESQAFVDRLAGLLRRDAAARGHHRLPPGASELAAAFDAVLGTAAPQLRTSGGRALVRVLASRLAEVMEKLWDDAYRLGYDIRGTGLELERDAGPRHTTPSITDRQEATG